MKKNLTYREKLLELASIYKISEIKNYINKKKNLTTIQIEHLLKKNNVPVPTELNKSLIEIHSKKITQPVYSIGSNLNNFFVGLKKATNFFFISIKKKITQGIYSIINGVFNFIKNVNKFTVDSLNKIYHFKVQEKKANKIVSGFVVLTFVSFIIVAGIQIKDLLFEKKLIQVKIEKNEAVKAPEKKEVAKVPEKKKEIAKAPEKKKEVAKAPEKKKEVVSELVLPDLNLKTTTVLALFDDVEYDLKKVRINKLVQPIYFTQFPKDLDEITSVKLKKETFIKIVLPLVVAENQKILDDRYKLKLISRKKMTSDKEKSWLRLKFKEYKVLKSSVKELEKRMDIIPVSIAIAQAAKESGWGTSRFALEGNAIFGQWTWNGKGIAPLDRSKEQSHKILRFPILRASVKAYKNNLNTHQSYKEFREIRYKLRSKNRSIEGKKLIFALNSYAQTGAEYTKTLAKIIDQNSLEEFENVKLTDFTEKTELNL
jgi:Bax protein